MRNIMIIIRPALWSFLVVMAFSSCEFIDDLPEEGSIPDETPPTADFVATQNSDITQFLTYTFGNLSDNATTYLWDFGDGSTSDEFEPVHIFPSIGTYTVSLTASDKLGAVSVDTEMIEVIEPVAPAVPDPVLLNMDFDRIAKSSGSDCTCSGWINTDIGEQGESSTGNGSDVVKFDNAEPDHIYQEFAVVPNAEYQIEFPILFQSDQTGDLPTQMEIRVLAGQGYVDGYTPIIYESTVDIPQKNFGYRTVAQVEEPANNLLFEVIDNLDNGDYRSLVYTFNSGANDSVALFIRGIGNSGPEDPEDFARYGYSSGDEEVRIDSITITAVNEN